MKTTFLLCLLPFLCTAQYSRYYVNQTANGANNGSSWADAFLQLNTALAYAQAGDTVWVAQGTYKPDAGSSRDASFNLPSRVVLLGGFSGYETDAGQRNWEQYPTVLSGDVGVPGDSTDNSYTVVYMYYPEEGTVIDGFRVVEGNANIITPSNYSPGNFGGGMYIMGEGGTAYPDIINCTFEHNRALNWGGAVYVQGYFNCSVAPRFMNCVFRNNYANWGAGVYRYGGSIYDRYPDFGNCVFENNRAIHNGGGLDFLDTEGEDVIEIIDCQFINNKVSNYGGAMFLELGRGQFGSKVLIDHSSFDQNSASRGSAYATFSYQGYSSFFSVKNCTATNNTGGDGVFYTQIYPVTLNSGVGAPSTMSMDNCVFENNRSNYSLIQFSGFEKVKLNKLSIRNNVVQRDLIVSYPYLYPNSNIATSATLFNCEISNNTDSTGNGIESPFGFGHQQLNAANLLVRGNTFKNNALFTNANPTLKNCDFIKNNSTFVGSGPDPISGNFINCLFWGNNNNFNKLYLSSNISITHSFVDLLNCATLPPNLHCSDFITGINPGFNDSSNDDYSLSMCSALIDAGTNTGFTLPSKDLAGNPRIQGSTVDIGCYEAPAFAFSTSPIIHASCAGGASGSFILQTLYNCGALTYNWQTPGGATGSNNTNLAPGIYYVSASDQANHQLRDTITIPENAPFVVSSVVTSYSCSNTEAGAVILDVQGGTVPYVYHWSNGQSGNSLQNLFPGFYAVTISDEAGCSSIQNIAIGSSGAIPITLQTTAISCPGDMNGALTPASIAGQSPFSFQWSNGANTPAIEGLVAGAYTLTVTDAIGCTGSATNEINEPTPLHLNTTIIHASGVNTADGAIQIQQTSGGAPPYQYAWSNGANTASIAQLLPGTYTVTLTDSLGCSLVQSFEVGVEVATSTPQSPTLFAIYPNPASNIIHLQSPAAGRLTWTLFDAQGRQTQQLFFNKKDSVYDLQLPDLPQGLYFYQIKALDATILQNGRFVIMEP